MVLVVLHRKKYKESETWLLYLRAAFLKHIKSHKTAAVKLKAGGEQSVSLPPVRPSVLPAGLCVPG